MFDSPHSALRWASLMKHTLIIDGSSINDMCGKPHISTSNELLKGLSPQEAQQQAANIFNYASSLTDPICSQYLKSKYFFLSSIDTIVQRVMGNILHAAGGTNRRDISVVVESYLGTRVSKREMREKLRCRAADVQKIEKQVYDAMDKIHYRAIDELQCKLTEAGLIKYS